jgi:hypothetical protein
VRKRPPRVIKPGLRGRRPQPFRYGPVNAKPLVLRWLLKFSERPVQKAISSLVTITMSTPGDANVPGSPKAQKLITTIGVILGVLWVLIGLPVAIGIVKPENIEAYQLGSKGGALWLQLMLYPFLGFSLNGLLFNLVWLAGLVRVARQCLTPAGFIRLYTLGTIGSGLIYWLLSRYLIAGEGRLTGSYLALITVHSALATLAPTESLLPAWKKESSVKPGRTLILVVFAVSWLIDARYVSRLGGVVPYIILDVISYPLPRLIVLGLMGSVRLKWWLVLLLLSHLWRLLWLEVAQRSQLFSLRFYFLFALVFFLNALAALALGWLYGRGEQFYSKHEARLRAS